MFFLVLAVALALLTCLGWLRMSYLRATIYNAILLEWQTRCLLYPNTGELVNVAPNSVQSPYVWRQFQAFCYAPPTRIGGTCLFLGLMTRPDGVERLVYLSAETETTKPGPSENYFAIDSWIVQAATRTFSERWITAGDNSYFTTAADMISCPGPTVHGAVLAPADPSHFTIAVQTVDGREITLDGFLYNDDRIIIEKREGDVPLRHGENTMDRL